MSEVISTLIPQMSVPPGLPRGSLGSAACRRLGQRRDSLPPGSPSLGELVSQGKNNLQAPWLGITAFVVLGGLLTLLIFVGEAVRDAFDPRKGPR